MNIVDFKSCVKGTEAEQDLNEVCKLCQYIGDNVANGYLESCIDSFNYDDYGNFEFHSLRNNGNLIIDSVGSLLKNSVVIKQRQVDPAGGIDNSYIISWNKEGSKYTFISFENSDVVDYAYDRIKASCSDYLDANASDVLERISVPRDLIKEIYYQDLKASQPRASFLTNFDDDIIEVLDPVVK